MKMPNLHHIHASPLIIAIFIISSLSAFSVDITTINGKTYSNVTVQRVEPDGISIKHSAGIIKLFANELPQDICEQYGLTPEAAKRYQAQRSAALQARDEQMRLNLAKRNEQWAKESEHKAAAKSAANQQAIAEANDPSKKIYRRWHPNAKIGLEKIIEGQFMGIGAGQALFMTSKGTYAVRPPGVFPSYEQDIIYSYNKTLTPDEQYSIETIVKNQLEEERTAELKRKMDDLKRQSMDTQSDINKLKRDIDGLRYGY